MNYQRNYETQSDFLNDGLSLIEEMEGYVGFEPTDPSEITISEDLYEQELEMDQLKVQNYEHYEEWDEYLSTVDVEQVEETLSGDMNIDHLRSDDYKVMFTDLIGQNYCANKESLFKVVLASLTKRQQQIINLLFWESMTVCEVANLLGLHHSTVIESRKSSLAKIKKVLEGSKKIILKKNNGKVPLKAA